MNLRRLVSKILPPLITDALRGEESTYPSWDEACRASAGTYDDELVNRFRVERAQLQTAEADAAPANALLLTVMSISKPDAAITDFGGATGTVGVGLLQHFGNVRYTVVENPTLVGLMTKHPSPVRFTTQMPDACDIFFCSGTLQCIENPFGVLEAGFRSARAAAVLARNSFCDREIFRVQHSPLFNNGSGPVPPGYKNTDITYPHRTIREAEVLNLARKQGFRCVARMEESSGVHPYKGMVYGRQLVFVRSL